MVTIKQGIPDDTPENSIHAIQAILKEEADVLSADFEVSEENDGAGRMVTIDLSRKTESFRVYVQCIDSQNLSRGHGTIGEGFIAWNLGGSSGRLVLEMFHNCPPYRWSIYSGDTQIGSTKPTDRFLTGTILRELVREKLTG
jgi:hypothetical protein